MKVWSSAHLRGQVNISDINSEKSFIAGSESKQISEYIVHPALGSKIDGHGGNCKCHESWLGQDRICAPYNS